MKNRDLSILIDLLETERIGCVSFSRYDHTIYYGICNDYDNARVKKELKNVFGDKAVHCELKESITYLRDVYFFDCLFYDNEFKFYNNLLIFKKADVKFIPYNFLKTTFSNKYEQRIFSCAERKVIGHLENMSVTNHTIFVNRPPCYLCLAAINKCWFFYEKRNVIVGMEKIDFRYSKKRFALINKFNF